MTPNNLLNPDTGQVLYNSQPDLTKDTPSDNPPAPDRNDLTSLDEDHLRGYILDMLRNDIYDKQDFGWLDKKTYNVAAYYGLKNEFSKHWPWEGASAFPIPMTPTFVDTAWANVQAGIWSNPNGPVKIPTLKREKIRSAKILERYMNWEVTESFDLETECDKHVFRTFLHGTGITKTMFDLRTGRNKVVSLDLENIYLPVDASGMQRDGTDHIIQMVPLSYVDIQRRKAMGVYRDVDSIPPGIGVYMGDSASLTRLAMDKASGVSMDRKVRRDTYYIMEVHLTYFPPNSLKPLDLIVWISPAGGTIQRIRKVDPAFKRPFEDAHAYPYPDRFYSMSLPEKVRNVQEKMDYCDKQYTDALDRANTPAAFVDDTDSFDRSRQQRVPGGIYPKGKGNTIDWEPQPPIERGVAAERDYLWMLGEKETGLIDVSQGAESKSKTLGEVNIRVAGAGVRFKSIFKRFEGWWSQVCEHIYQNDFQYTDKSKIIEVIGNDASKYTVNELFPVDQDGKLSDRDFQFSGLLAIDEGQVSQKKTMFYQSQLSNPAVIQDPGALWRVENEIALASGITDYESVVFKPKVADILPAKEFINRVVSGEKDLQLYPGIDTDSYVFEIQLFMKTELFQTLDDYQKQILQDNLRRAFVMGAAERQAQMDVQLVRDGAAAGALPPQVSPQSPQNSPQMEPQSPQSGMSNGQ